MLADAAQALAGGVRELLDRDVDELAGQLGDEPLELELLLERLLPVGRALVGRAGRRTEAQHEGAFGRPQRAHLISTGVPESSLPWDDVERDRTASGPAPAGRVLRRGVHGGPASGEEQVDGLPERAPRAGSRTVAPPLG